jgi:GTP-binding protein EngB required for normal cell division
MGQAVAVAGVLGLGAAGAYKVVERLQGSALRSEPRHAPGILEAEQARQAVKARLEEQSDVAEVAAIAADDPAVEETSEQGNGEPTASCSTPPRLSEHARMVAELRAVREQAERTRLEHLADQRQRAAAAVSSTDPPVLANSAQECAKPVLKNLRLGELQAMCSEAEVHAREEARRRYPQPQWLKTKGCINVAVTGNAGVGKSSFINTIRGLRPRDDGAADVSPNETTMEPSCYDYPGLPLATKLWDLPGAGTQRFPREGYIQSMGLRYFDVVIIVTATRYTETEVMIADELQRFGVPYLMVRNKVDADVTNNQDDHDAAEESTLAMIRNDMQKQGVACPYLVSSKFARKSDFDMNQLKEDALQAICDAREAPQGWVQASPRDRAILNLPTPTRTTAHA